jgi:hypothetical protein
MLLLGISTRCAPARKPACFWGLSLTKGFRGVCRVHRHPRVVCILRCCVLHASHTIQTSCSLLPCSLAPLLPVLTKLALVRPCNPKLPTHIERCTHSGKHLAACRLLCLQAGRGRRGVPLVESERERGQQERSARERQAQPARLPARRRQLKLLHKARVAANAHNQKLSPLRPFEHTYTLTRFLPKYHILQRLIEKKLPVMSTFSGDPSGVQELSNSPNFHNTQPRSREERLAAQSREKLEKSLLKARRGCFHRYEEQGNPVVPQPTSPMYSDEANRFRRDVAGEMRQHKVEAFERQQVRVRAAI